MFDGNVSGNDFDVDGDAFTARLVGDVSGGTLVFNSDGSFSYDPGAFTGTARFSYDLQDASSTSLEAQVSLQVNARPLAVADGYSVAEDGVLTVAAGCRFAWQ